MNAERRSQIRQSIKTPRAAAVAGIMFAILFGTALTLIRVSMPPSGETAGPWLEQDMATLKTATNLVPYAGIAFLWFIGVVRDHLGSQEDRFFATVFLGSGLLFLAMTFSATAVVIGVIATYSFDPSDFYNREVYAFGRALIGVIFNIFAIRMGSVFMISSATLWARSKAMPYWLVIFSYAVALTLMVTISVNLWVTLLFPAWVLVISIYILINNLRSRAEPAGNIEPA